jgi:hypothetical protein
MIQQELKLLGRIDAPSMVPSTAIAEIETYREAVIACWLHRRSKSMTRATLCELTGMRPSHVSDYLSLDLVDRKGRELREMPAKYVPAFERATGNTFVSQWMAMQSKLPVIGSMPTFDRMVAG